MPASPLVLCDWAVSCLLAPFETGQVISLLLETGGQKSQDLNAPASTCLYLLKTHPKTDARGHHVLIMQTHEGSSCTDGAKSAGRLMLPLTGQTYFLVQTATNVPRRELCKTRYWNEEKNRLRIDWIFLVNLGLFK
jgi:hypothetical protein